MEEGSRHFEERSAVHKALRRITRKLEELGIAYAVAGGMALFLHGYRRFTEDVDILVTKNGLKEIHKQLEGRGYLPPFTRSKQLRDTELGVRIEFLVAGQYPGDGKPKPVAFPDPTAAAVDIDGMKCVGLASLIEMKLASGMTSTGRARDLVDVQELIATLKLKKDLVSSLNEYVRDTYEKLWDNLYGEEKRYMTYWRNKWLTADANSVEDMVRSLRSAADELEQMLADGVQIDPNGGTADDYALLVTTDPEVAAKYQMHPESEFLGEADDDDE